MRETGDAQPDFAKLVALADALQMDLNILCGREAAEPQTPAVQKPKRKSVWITAFFATVLFVVGIFVGTLLSKKEVKATSVTGLRFVRVAETDTVRFHFLPELVGEGYTYTLSFADGTDEPLTVLAECRDGKCAGQVDLQFGKTYTVFLTVFDGKQQHKSTLAQTLRLGKKTVLWE